ncbi:MAG: hypothetical protein WAU39_03745 [Polyangiales bacterium]
MQERSTRHIVVVFGGGSADAALVRVLGSLVTKSGADISGVFLEDQTLFRLAQLPFITEVSRLTTIRRPLAAQDLERQLKVQARRAERELRRFAESLGLPWSFRTHRGPLSSAIDEASRIDLLLLGAARRALGGEPSATSRFGRGAEAEPLRPIGVLLERKDTGHRAIEAAIELARSTGRPLVLFDSRDSAHFGGDLTARLQSLGPKRVAIRRLQGSDPHALAVAIRRASPAMLVAAAGEEGFEERRISLLRREIWCPVVVVRGQPD